MPAEDRFGPEEFARLTDVSRETLARLKAYAAMLDDWGARHNLVSRNSLADVWRRHMWDSAQLVPLIPQGARTLADLGSGAGFPGLVLAELLRDRGISFTLYEATGKKCRFLEAVAARLGLAVTVRCDRVEATTRQTFDVVAARALAPMDRLLEYAERFWGPATIGLFLKSQSVDAELTAANESWKMKVKRYPSRSDARGVIVEIRGLRRAARP